MSINQKLFTLLVALPYLISLFLMISGLQVVDTKYTIKQNYYKMLSFFNNLFLVLFFILSIGFFWEFDYFSVLAAHFLASSIAIRSYIDKFELAQQ